MRDRAGDGHDGTWVAHPGLVPVAMEVFNRLMPGKNQLDRQRPSKHEEKPKDYADAETSCLGF